MRGHTSRRWDDPLQTICKLPRRALADGGSEQRRMELWSKRLYSPASESVRLHRCRGDVGRCTHRHSPSPLLPSALLSVNTSSVALRCQHLRYMLHISTPPWRANNKHTFGMHGPRRHSAAIEMRTWLWISLRLACTCRECWCDLCSARASHRPRLVSTESQPKVYLPACDDSRRLAARPRVKACLRARGPGGVASAVRGSMGSA